MTSMSSEPGFGPMSIVSTITITPEQPTGIFQPGGSLTEWSGHLVHVAGLDPAYEHTLQAVEIVPGPRMVLDVQAGRYVEQIVDGGAAVLTVITEAPFVPCHANYVRVVSGLPPARVQIVAAEDGEVLIERARYPTPHTEGQQIAIGEQHYSIVGVDWPNRDPVSGTSGAREDYQRVHVVPIPDQDPLRLVDSEGGGRE